MTLTSADIPQGHWNGSGAKRAYVLADSKPLKNELVQIGDDAYLFDNEGYSPTGWQEISDSWYFFGNEGRIQTGWIYGGAWPYLF